jgi:anti-sigma factor RsiW
MNDTSLGSVHDDLEAYALGVLDHDDERRFVDHLRACDQCRDGLVSYIAVTNALRSLPVALPPPLPPTASPVRVLAPARPWRMRPAFYGAMAAAAAMLLVVGAALLGFGRPQGDRTLMAVAGMMADGPRQAALIGDGVRGRLIIGHRNLRAAIVVRGLSAAPAGEAYQVWIVDSKPVLVGALAPARDNLEVLLFDASRLNGGHVLRVSLEPVNARAPSGASLATGAY